MIEIKGTDNHYKLMTPGPINVPAITSDLLVYTPPYFAGKDFSELLESIQAPLKRIFRTKEPVMIGTGSGSLGMESVLANFFDRGNQIVIFNLGKYATNWAMMAREYHGVIVHEIEVNDTGNWSEHLDELVRMLENYPIAGVFMTHCETTNAITTPINLITKIVKDLSPETLTVVDAISTLAVQRLNASKHDVVISCSQKGLQLPPGLFFMTASPYAFSVAEMVNRRSFYFDVVVERKRTLSNTTSHTPASNLFIPLKYTVDSIDARVHGVNSVTRHCQMLQAECCDILRLNDIERHRTCPVVTSIKTDKASEILSIMAKRGWIAGGGVREDAGKLVRLMHFGWCTYTKFIHDGTLEFVKAYKEVHGG